MERPFDRIGAALSHAQQREWHQFRLLSRDAIRRLLDTALFARDSDPMAFAVWMLAMIATPPSFFAARQIFLYTALKKAPAAVVEQIALGHRIFFVVYGMLATALVAALTWEALFPDGSDQEIVGVLPVRARTFAASRLCAAVIVGAGLAVAVNVPAAVIYTFIAASHPSLRNIPGLLTGHLLATMMGAMTVYMALLTVRGIAAIALGARVGAWLGAALQLVTVVLLVEVFFFLPGVLGTLVKAMLAGDPRAAAFPPVWFAAIHNWIGGSANPIIASGARVGAISFAMAAVVTVPVYLLPAAFLARRALERRSRERAASVVSVLSAAGRFIIRRPAVRGIFTFAMASLLRSRRHLLVLATYFGLAIATSVASILIIEVHGTFVVDTPASWTLALPLVFQFFLCLGLRACFRIPTEMQPNWPFRLSQPTLNECVTAAALIMFVLGIVPTALVASMLTAPLWPLDAVVKAATMQLLTGVVLIELALVSWTKVPFASEHVPSTDTLKALWLGYAIAMYVYAFQLSDWQFAALSSRRAISWYLAAGAVAIVTARIMRRQKWRGQSLEFDASEPHAVERLNLSEAVN